MAYLLPCYFSPESLLKEAGLDVSSWLQPKEI